MNLKFSIFLCSCFLILFTTSCDEKSKQSNEKEESEESVAEKESDITIATENVEAMNASANAVLDFRYKEQGKESYAIIEMDRWEYEFIAKGSDIREARNGLWIDFFPDLTYTYGDNDGQKGTGRYHYNFENGLLLIVDSDNSVKPQEYEAKIAGPTMVLVGKSTYRDNHLQMKLMQNHVPE